MAQHSPASAEFVLLELALPGRPIRIIGVLLLEKASKRLYWMLRTDWDGIAPPEDAEVLHALDEDFAAQAHEMGGERFLLSLEDQLSNALRLSDRRTIGSADPVSTVRALFDQYCSRNSTFPLPGCEAHSADPEGNGSRP